MSNSQRSMNSTAAWDCDARDMCGWPTGQTKKNQSGRRLPTADLWCQFQLSGKSLRPAPAPDAPESEVSETASALLTACSKAYDDFELEEIPVIAEEMATHVLYKLGAEFLRHYCQGIWLKDGHPRFYRHVDGFYTKLLARMEKQELQPALIGQER